MNSVEIIIVLDRSGSMSTIAQSTVDGFNEFIKGQRELKAGKCLVTLTQFDTEYQVVYSGKDVNDVPPLNFVPRGGTALLDAIGQTINTVGERLSSTPEQDRPDKVVFVIITDGEENSSREFTSEQIRTMIEHQTNVYSWEFVYIGANQDAFQVGNQYGISSSNVLGFASTNSSNSRMYTSVSANLKNLRTGATANMSFTPDDYKNQEDTKSSSTL